MLDRVDALRGWFSWGRIAATLALAAVVAALAVAVWRMPGAGGVGRVVVGGLDLVLAALLVWVLRRREDLATPEGRWLDFVSRHTPAPDDIACVFLDSLAIDLACVVVDRAADRILFERCHASRRWPLEWNEERYACRVADLAGMIRPIRGTEDAPEEALPLVVFTPRGRAAIPPDADGVAALTAFLESRVGVRRRTAGDDPEAMNAVVGGALVGMAAGATFGLWFWPGLSEAAFAGWFLGGTIVGAFLTHAVLDLVDRVCGIDLASPVGGAVKGATIALQGSLPLAYLATSLGMEWTWLWVPPVAIALGGLLGAAGGRRTARSSPPPASTLAQLEERWQDRLGGGGPAESESLCRCLVAQWERRRGDARAYVGDLLHDPVREAHANGRAGAWRPELEVAAGEVRVACGRTSVGPSGANASPADDTPDPGPLLRAILGFARILHDSPHAPFRLILDFPRSEGVAALVHPTHPDLETRRRLGFDAEGRLVVGLRTVAPSPGARPLLPLADVLRGDRGGGGGGGDGRIGGGPFPRRVAE